MAVAVSPWPMMPQPMVANWILSFAAVWPGARAAAPSASDAAPPACRKCLRVDAMFHIILPHTAFRRRTSAVAAPYQAVPLDSSSPDDSLQEAVLVLEDEGRRRAFDAGAGVKRSPPSPENGRPKCESRDSCLSRSSVPTPSHGIAGLNLRRPWLPPASISKSASRAWMVATPDRRKFAVRITSYPELDISVPSGRGYRAPARGDGRLTRAGWNQPQVRA